MRSRPGAARTILFFHIISARPSKQPRKVGSTLGVYRWIPICGNKLAKSILFEQSRVDLGFPIPHEIVRNSISTRDCSKTNDFANSFPNLGA